MARWIIVIIIILQNILKQYSYLSGMVQQRSVIHQRLDTYLAEAFRHRHSLVKHSRIFERIRIVYVTCRNAAATCLNVKGPLLDRAWADTQSSRLRNGVVVESFKIIKSMWGIPSSRKMQIKTAFGKVRLFLRNFKGNAIACVLLKWLMLPFYIVSTADIVAGIWGNCRIEVLEVSAEGLPFRDR